MKIEQVGQDGQKAPRKDPKTNWRDITGQTFGYLTALEPTSERHVLSVIWKTKCRCGKDVYTSCVQLTRQIVKSCGCHKEILPKREHVIPEPIIVGNTYLGLTAMEQTDIRMLGYVAWKCQCSVCKKELIVSSHDLRRGSCKHICKSS